MTRPILLDFMADWCVPCKAMGIILAELEKEYDFELRKINVDKQQSTALFYNVTSIPTIILHIQGENDVRLVGNAGKANILKLFEGKVQRRK